MTIPNHVAYLLPHAAVPLLEFFLNPMPIEHVMVLWQQLYVQRILRCTVATTSYPTHTTASQLTI